MTKKADQEEPMPEDKLPDKKPVDWKKAFKVLADAVGEMADKECLCHLCPAYRGCYDETTCRKTLMQWARRTF